MSPPDTAISLSVTVTSIVGFLFTAGWGLVIWLLRRMVGQVERAVETVDAHNTQLALHAAELSTLRAEVTHLRGRYDDLVGFLRDQGFRKREG